MSEKEIEAHIIGDLKKLSTPWVIALERAYRVSKCDLEGDMILDLACGSAIQLAAYSSKLNKPCIGIEIDSERVKISEKTLKTILKRTLGIPNFFKLIINLSSSCKAIIFLILDKSLLDLSLINLF